MSYKIEFPDTYTDVKIFYLFKDGHMNYLQYLKGTGSWLIHNNTDLLSAVPDLSTLTEEEYFQLSLLWDYVFPIGIALKIMTVSKSEEYNFSKIKSVLIKEGIIE